LLRNSFCKGNPLLFLLCLKFRFQSSLLRNSFCKSVPRFGEIFKVLTFNPRCWGTLFASVMTRPLPNKFVRFQSSLLRNSFCKNRDEILKTNKPIVFQSSLLRNSFCKGLAKNVVFMPKAPFNPRCWGTLFASTTYWIALLTQ